MSTARKLIKNTTASVAAQVGTRALGFVYAAALARYVHAEGMGELATAQSLATIVALLIGLGHETLTISELAHDRSQSSVWLSSLLALKLAFSVVAMGALMVWNWVVGYSAATQEIILVYGIGIVVGTLVSTVRAVILARERQVLEASTLFARDALNIGLSLLAIWLGASLVTIVWVSVLANVVHLALELLVLQRLRLAHVVAPSVTRARAILRQGLPFGANALISVLLAQLGPVLLSLQAGAEITGLFWAANNLVLLLLVPSITYYWSVLPVFARLHESAAHELAALYRYSLKATTLLGLPLAVGGTLLAQPLIEFVYGPGFEAAVLALQLLVYTVAVAGDYVNGALLTALRRQRTLAISYGLELLALILLSVLLTPSLGAAGVALGYAAPRVIGAAARTWLGCRMLGLELPLDMLLRAAGATAVMAASVLAGASLGVHFLILALLIGPLVYVGALIVVGGVNAREWRLLRQAVQVG